MQVNGSRRRARDIQFDQLSGQNFAGDCEAPVIIRYRGLPDQIMVGLGSEQDAVKVVYISGRCRLCPKCLMHRQRLWAARAIDECVISTRSWFGTLTVRPDERVKYMYTAQLRYERAALESWDKLDTSDQFRKLCEAIAPEITRFLKRVRKNAAPFRYLLVTEAHEDGFPHFHILVHESEGVVLKKVMTQAWRAGFSQWKLIPVGEPKAASYACKYLSKSALTRVRASQRYGHEGRKLRVISERLVSASRSVRNVGEQLRKQEPSPKVSKPGK